jgi:oligopeptide transport system substrate-binding protein
MKFTTVLRAAAVAGALAFAVIGGAASAVTLNLHNGGDPGSLDPHKVSGDWENRPIGDFLEGLMAEDAGAEPIPGMAESYTVSDDGTVYTFKIRANAVWSDGEPVTAYDFDLAFHRLYDPATAAKYAYLQNSIKNGARILEGTKPDEEGKDTQEAMPVSELGVKAIDDKTLEITLEQPTPFFLGTLTHYTAFPIPKHVYDKVGDAFADKENLLANGPYKVVEWLPGSYIHSVKNDKYYDAANVKIDDVYYHVLEDDAGALNRYRAGEFDILTAFPSDQMDFINKELPGQAHVVPYLGIYYYVVNQTVKPLDDVNIRKALSMAVNRLYVTKSLEGTGSIPAYGYVQPGVANYEGVPEYIPAWAPKDDAGYAQNVADAKAIMEAAGYTDANPLKLTLKYNTSDLHQRIAVGIQGMWKAIHVEIELLNADVTTHYDQLTEGDFQIGRAGWQNDFNDPSNTLDLLRTGVENNYGRYSNPEYDRLMAEAAKTLDLKARAALMGKAEALAMDEFAAIPFYYNVTRVVVSPKISGFVDNAKDVHRTRWLSKSE